MGSVSPYSQAYKNNTISSATAVRGTKAGIMTDNRNKQIPADQEKTPQRLQHTLQQQKKNNTGQEVVQGNFLTNLGIGLGSVLTGGLGLLAYGGYRYYRHRQRENTLNAIRNEQAGQPIPAGVNVLPAGTGMDVASTAQTNDVHTPQGARNYSVNINPNNPVGLGRTDAHLMDIAEMHERTHISADMAYSSNANQANMFLMHGDPADPGFGADMYQQNINMNNRTDRLNNIVANDNALTDQQRAELTTRVNYSGQPNEYDPVINELLAYTKAYGIRANSKTVKALVTLARENLARRQVGGPNLGNNLPV